VRLNNLDLKKVCIRLCVVGLSALGFIELVIKFGWLPVVVAASFAAFGLLVVGITLIIVLAVERAAASATIKRKHSAKHRRRYR